MIIKLNIKKYFNWTTLTGLVFLIFFGILIYILKPLLDNQIIIGWDSPAHYYLTEQMLNYLEHFRLSGYNIYSYAGHPMFVFYNPLFYVIVCLIHLLSFKLIPLYLCLNIVLFILPFIYLIAVYYVSNVFFNNKKINLYALLFGFLTLFLLGNNGLGLASEINVGLFLNTLAWPLMLFLLAALERLRQTNQSKYLWLAIFLAASLILSHIFTALFAAFIIIVYVFLNFKQMWKPALIIGFGSLILTVFWWLPFLLNLTYTSAESIFNTNNQDPIFGIFPKYFLGAFLFVFSICGIGKLIEEKKYFFPAVFLFSLIIIPRDILNTIIKIPVHYYRFISGLALINVFISAYGFNFLMNWIKGWKILKQGELFSKIPWVAGLAIYLACLMVSSSLAYFNIENFQDFRPTSSSYSQDIGEIDNIVNYIKDNQLAGRFLVDTNSASLLTKHYFDYIFPKNEIYDMRGLLYESSLSGRFIYSSTGSLFDYKSYMSVVFIDDRNEGTLGQDNVNKEHVKNLIKVLKRMGQMGVKYLIVDNKNIDRSPVLDFANSKYNKGEIKTVKEFGHFTLLEIKDSAPLIGQTDYAPFLFVDSGGIFKKLSFKNLSLPWFLNGYTLDQPLIYTNKPVDKLTEVEKSYLGGFVVSYKNGKSECPSNEQMDYWIKFNKPIIFLDSKEDCQKPNENIYFVKDIDEKSQIEQAYNIIANLSPEKFSVQEVKPEIIENEKIKFNSQGGTLVNFSYFPKWKSLDKNQTIFWITPSMMFIFANGETELNYK